MRNALFSLFLLCTLSLSAQIKISSQYIADFFPLVSRAGIAEISYDKADFEVVHKATTLFAADIERVTDKKPRISTGKLLDKEIVLVGTLGYNKKIDELISSGKLNVNSIRGNWERFIIKTINDPFPGVSKALVVVGSDRRGTAFGVFTLSEAIGVSPWYWWLMFLL